MGKYVSYTVDFKLKVVNCAKENGKLAVCWKLQVDEKCVQQWHSQEGGLIRTNAKRCAFRGKRSMFPQIQDLLLQYVTEKQTTATQF